MKNEGDNGLNNNEAVKVMGIDPGLASTGYAMLEQKDECCRLLEYGCIHTPARQDLAQRLMEIFRGICLLIDRFTPAVMAVEQLFFCKNVRTAMQVGEARGVVLTAAATRSVSVVEYTPLQVKQAVAGFGRAEKKQVQQMVALILKMPELPEPDDAADAIAIALCHIQSRHWRKKVENFRL